MACMVKTPPLLLSLIVTLAAVSPSLAGDKEAELKAICAEAEAEAAKQGLSASGPAKDGKGFTILLYKYRFCPQSAKVAKGTPVTWINVDKRTSHSVWFKEAGKDESERLFNADTWQMTLDKPGTYHYLCGPHWEKEGMSGTLEVRP